MRRTDLTDKMMRWLLAILCLLICAAIAGLGVLIGSKIEDAATRARAQATSRTIEQLHASAELTCRRLNITRATDNQAHLQNYQLYQFLLNATRASSSAAEISQAERVAIRHLQDGQAAATWTPLINCTAPREELKALSLQPIAFSHTLPPMSALSPVNASRPDPVGSVF